MAQKNVEIKARCSNPQFVLDWLKAEPGIEFVGDDHQIDTYFDVEEGRLKMREGNVENALVFYRRPDQGGPKVSSVFLHHFTPGPGVRIQTNTVKEILKQAIGEKVVVDKQRKIFWHATQGVKFHVDEVVGLGSFVEIEVIDPTGEVPEKEMQAVCQDYMDIFQVMPEDLLSCSYSDLLLSDEAILERWGWTIDCESPFEISHGDGSRATGQGAYMVLDGLKQAERYGA